MADDFVSEEDRRGPRDGQKWAITKPYTRDDMLRIFGGYLTQGHDPCLRIRDIRLIETIMAGMEESKSLTAERDRARAELLRARNGIDEACTQNRELARQLEALLEGSKP